MYTPAESNVILQKINMENYEKNKKKQSCIKVESVSLLSTSFDVHAILMIAFKQ